MNILFLNDYDVLGVGAQKKRALLERVPSSQFVLKTHPLDFLPGVLEETLGWLRPREIRSAELESKQNLMMESMARLFPLGVKFLTQTGLDADRLLKSYLEEMPWQEGLRDDHLRYWNIFLQKALPRTSEKDFLSDVFTWEWLRNSLSYRDFGDGCDGEDFSGPSVAQMSGPPTPQEGAVLVSLNPSLQIFRLERESVVLERDRGLYAFVYSPRTNQLIEKKLSLPEAYLLDLLNEERAFTPEQLVEFAMLEGPAQKIDKKRILSALDLLRADDIIRA